MNAIRPLPVELLAQRLLTASLNLEEAANICAINPSMENFHEMLVAMRDMHDCLTTAYREIAVS